MDNFFIRRKLKRKRRWNPRRKVHFRNTFGTIACKTLRKGYIIPTYDPFKGRAIVCLLETPEGIFSSNRWKEVTCKQCKHGRGWGGDLLKKFVTVGHRYLTH